MKKQSIENKHWIWTNERIRDLSQDCRDLLLDFAKEDVRVCFENNGMHDPLCLQLAEEVNEMEDYLMPR